MTDFRRVTRLKATITNAITGNKLNSPPPTCVKSPITHMTMTVHNKADTFFPSFSLASEHTISQVHRLYVSGIPFTQGPAALAAKSSCANVYEETKVEILTSSFGILETYAARLAFECDPQWS